MKNKSIAFLDLCSISYLKNKESILAGNDQKKIERLNSLLELKNNYIYSFSIAILEKCTDFKNNLSKQELIDRFQKDYDDIIRFIEIKDICETNEKIIKQIEILMDETTTIDERAELDNPSYLSFLKFYNSFGLTNTPAKEKRFNYSSLLIKKAVELDFSRSHPVVVLCISSIYGCESARDILKIKNNIEDFNPNNCLGDILTFSRIAKFQSIMKNAIFRTEDTALEKMHTYFKTVLVSESNNNSHYETVVFDEINLFPSLFKNKKCNNFNEFRDLINLLGWNIDLESEKYK